ncbi:MAG TPA: sulfate ABC transporter permease subunit CysW [Candidatus Polarisedimenticolaceae bacterium]|nr:sulfate ABC transporter permease subunit CysW [Candidatus Polarisedimenticolaceae bacterium]
MKEVTLASRGKPREPRAPSATEPLWVRSLLVAVALGFLLLFLVLPLSLVFAKAFADGGAAWAAAVTDPVARASLRLTLLTAAIVLPVNVVFGVAAAWATARFRFRGRNLILTLIDLPFSVSPVVSGMVFVLLFGASGWFGPWLQQHGIQIVFAVPGIVLATLFVTAPFVARELVPSLEAQGIVEEEAALTLGAGGFRTFVSISLPKVRWALLYGIVLCTARAIGEFGAVSVVSGHIRGRTTTVPLHVEMLYNEYQFTAAFAVASMLAVLALVTLMLKYLIERRSVQGRR